VVWSASPLSVPASPAVVFSAAAPLLILIP
jgi:hypothetical protein